VLIQKYCISTQEISLELIFCTQLDTSYLLLYAKPSHICLFEGNIGMNPPDERKTIQ